MSKVSDGRSVRVGLVGPKPRLKSVGDGQPVNIPVPECGVGLRPSREGEPLSGLRWQVVNDHDAGGQPQKSLTPGGKKSLLDVEAHRPYHKPTQVDRLRKPRRTGEPLLRN